MITKCKVDLCRYYNAGMDTHCETRKTDISDCVMHQPDPRDKIIKDQAMRIIAQETDKFYDTIVSSMRNSKLTLRIETAGGESHITLTGPSGTFGFTVGNITDRSDYNQAIDKFNRVMRLANE